FTGSVATRDATGKWTIETTPGGDLGSLAVGAGGVLYGFFTDLSKGTVTYAQRSGAGWQTMESIPSAVAREGGLVNDSAGCLYGALDNSSLNTARAGHYATNWVFDPMEAGSSYLPRVTLAPSGRPHFLYWQSQSGTSMDQLRWSSPPALPES